MKTFRKRSKLQKKVLTNNEVAPGITGDVPLWCNLVQRRSFFREESEENKCLLQAALDTILNASNCTVKIKKVIMGLLVSPPKKSNHHFSNPPTT